MSRENVEIVLRVMQRFADHDLDAALQDVDAEATLDWSNSDALDSGVYTGRAAWRAFMQERDAALAERRVDTVEILAATIRCGRPRGPNPRAGAGKRRGGRDSRRHCLDAAGREGHPPQDLPVDR